MPFTVFSSRGLAALTGETSDPILDLVTQISGLRRSSSSTHSELAREIQQLQVVLLIFLFYFIYLYICTGYYHDVSVLGDAKLNKIKLIIVFRQQTFTFHF